MRAKTLNVNKMAANGRGWQPESPFQEIVFNTYTTKSNACKRLGLAQYTIDKLFKDELRLTIKQLNALSWDSKLTINDILKTL